MPKVKAVEKRIWDVEGFDIAFQQNGRDIRGDREGVPQYSYQRAAKDDMTVSEWREIRFFPSYPGFDVAVIDGNGNAVHGGTKLGTVRDTYSDE